MGNSATAPVPIPRVDDVPVPLEEQKVKKRVWTEATFFVGQKLKDAEDDTYIPFPVDEVQSRAFLIWLYNNHHKDHLIMFDMSEWQVNKSQRLSDELMADPHGMPWVASTKQGFEWDSAKYGDDEWLHPLAKAFVEECKPPGLEVCAIDRLTETPFDDSGSWVACKGSSLYFIKNFDSY